MNILVYSMEASNSTSIIEKSYVVIQFPHNTSSFYILPQASGILLL